MFQKLFEGGGREESMMIEALKKRKRKALKLFQCIDILQGNESTMKERDERKAITMLSSRNSPIIARKAI